MNYPCGVWPLKQNDALEIRAKTSHPVLLIQATRDAATPYPGGVELHTSPAVADDPVAAWTYHADTVQALLDDPERAAAQYSYERVGSMPVAEAIDRFYTSDIFMHTWDLARASGQDVTLEPEFCTELLAGMEPMEEAMRSSGQYGPKVDVPAGVDPQTRMIGFIGRDPSWRPDTPT
jgi:uncharacterized protein (TIGR03086 family)